MTPLHSITTWRAFVIESTNAEAGRTILLTGIGGGVAIMVLLFAVARGCNVFVISLSADKIARTEALDAKGGVDYTDKK